MEVIFLLSVTQCKLILKAILAATKDNEDFGTELENVMNGYEELSKSVEENTVRI